MRSYKFYHHKHTGTLLHHRHTHYPVLVILVAVTAALAFLTGQMARADDMLVSAKVPAPMPAGAPAFTSPADNSVVTQPSVEFSGTCPVITPAITVVLHEGNSTLGSDTCSPSGLFAVNAMLAPGTHDIVATVYTITDDAGQSSSPLRITYQPPITPTTPSPNNGPSSSPPTTNGGTQSTGSTPSAGTQNPAAPLEITTELPFLTYAKKTPAEWRGQFSGGMMPYTVIISWGDGSHDTYTVRDTQTQSFTHTYSYRLKTNMTATFLVKDATGMTLQREYAVRYIGAIGSGASTTDSVMLPDMYSFDTTTFSLIIYLCLLLTMLLMWRYEHIHYRRVFGVALHYRWQKPHKK